jgi:cell division protein FtsI (penicillin-binding protein 3)
MNDSRGISVYENRRLILISLFLLGMAALMWRAVDLHVLNKEFLQEHGDARALRVVEIPAHRGMILDRNGEPLAVSTPVHSIWATPRKVLSAGNDLSSLAEIIKLLPADLINMLKDRIGRDFVYIKRHIDPETANKVMQLDIPGIYLDMEFRRYYPAGEVVAHIVGFTNIDDIGQEGLELAYDDWLKGTRGSKRVLKDRLGRIVENVESISIPKPGKNLDLSIDLRIQYLAYRELKTAVNSYKALGGTLVMLDAMSGEVVAMVSQPSYNPNNRNDLKSEFYRNRAVTDVFEPGSTLKPFTIIAALLSGIYSTSTTINTNPGYLTVGNHTIRDIKNYGIIDLANVIKKSSNVGASKIALSMEPYQLWRILSSFGIGLTTSSGYPGEVNGHLGSATAWSEVELATIAFGYGLSVTALQLANAYQILAANGMMLPISFVKTTETITGKQIIPPELAAEVRSMLSGVVSDDGTGKRAAVNGYHVAGKTGTVHKATGGGYSENRYISLFAGMAPAENPRLVTVVVIDEPKGKEYYGGQVAAPVFSKVMTGALRLMDIAPDNLPDVTDQIVARKVLTTGVAE